MQGLSITKLADMLIRDVVLHACLGVDGKLNIFIYRASQPAVVISRVQVVGIVFWVICFSVGSASQAHLHNANDDMKWVHGKGCGLIARA